MCFQYLYYTILLSVFSFALRFRQLRWKLHELVDHQRVSGRALLWQLQMEVMFVLISSQVLETLFWGVISDFSQYHPILISMFMSFSTVPHMFPISIVVHRFLDGIWSNHHGTWWQIPTQQLQSIDPLWVLVVNFSEVTVCCPVFDPGMNIR